MTLNAPWRRRPFPLLLLLCGSLGCRERNLLYMPGEAGMGPVLDSSGAGPGDTASPGNETLALDSAASIPSPAGPASSLSWSHVAGAGIHMLLVVGCALRNPGAQTISSVAYDGQPLKFIAGTNNGTNVRIEQWELLAPAPGSKTIVVTVSGSARLACGSMTFTGVDQKMPRGPAAGSWNVDGSPTVTLPSAGGELVCDVTGSDAGQAATADAAQTRRWNVATTQIDAAGSTKPGAAMTTMKWSNNAANWAVQAISLRPYRP